MLIGELAACTDTTPRALRYYEERGLLAGDRMENGYRRYDEDAVLRVTQIRALLAAGFGTESMAVLLPCASGAQARLEMCPQVAAEMARVLAGIDDELRRLEDRRAAVARLA